MLRRLAHMSPVETALAMTAASRTIARGQLSRYAARNMTEAEQLENELRTRIGTEHALVLNSGTSGLIAALVGAGVGPGDEVLVPAYTWVSTAAAAMAVGAVPVLVDIDWSLGIDPEDICRKITPHTKAIIPVHMLNLVCDMDAIMEIARINGLIVIEDACQAVGARYKGRRVGSIGHVGVFSFNQQKNIKSGEGGALVTNDLQIYQRALMYHDVGSYLRETRVESDQPPIIGVGLRMPELSASILRPQLRRLDRQMEARRRHRRLAIERLERSDTRAQLSPHHDPQSAVGITVRFDEPEDARRFATATGVTRLIDGGKHVYTNWESVLGGRMPHPRLDPYAWAHREFDLSPESCPRTIDILSRTCSIDLLPNYPTFAYRMFLRRIAR